MVAAAAQPIGRNSDPLMHGDLEDPQVSRRLERQPQIIGPMTARAKGYGISDGVKSGFLEDAHRARHMKGGGDDDPALGRLRMDDRSGEAGVLIGVAGFVLNRHPVRRLSLIHI